MPAKLKMINFKNDLTMHRKHMYMYTSQSGKFVNLKFVPFVDHCDIWLLSFSFIDLWHLVVRLVSSNFS